MAELPKEHLNLEPETEMQGAARQGDLTTPEKGNQGRAPKFSLYQEKLGDWTTVDLRKEKMPLFEKQREKCFSGALGIATLSQGAQ